MYDYALDSCDYSQYLSGNYPRRLDYVFFTIIKSLIGITHDFAVLFDQEHHWLDIQLYHAHIIIAT